MISAVVLGISESKFDDSILPSKIHLHNYDRLFFYWNRNGGGVACYIRNNLSYEVESFWGGAEIESIFLELLLPNTKPVVVGINYRPPRQSEVLEIIKTHFSKLDTNISKIYISGNFIVNLYLITFFTFIYLITFFKKKLLKSQSIPSDIKKCYESCRI